MSWGLMSSEANCVKFVRYQPSSLPNEKNTLNENLKHGKKKIIDYCQKFNYDDEIELQFVSDIATPPVLTIYHYGVSIRAISGTLAATVTGTEGTRYYFNYTVIFSSSIQNKRLTIKVVQDTETLISEPIWCYDMASDLVNRKLLRIDYSNFDAYQTWLLDKLINWSALTTTDKMLFFYVEAQQNDPADSDESENMDGALQKEKISSTNFFGNTLKTGIIPLYMARRLELVSSLAFFSVHGVEYLKNGGVEVEVAGDSTSVQASMKLIDKIATGITVDNLKFEDMAGATIQVDGQLFEDVTADFDVAIPDGYMYNLSIVAKSATAGTGDFAITIGSTLGGSEYCDEYSGVISDTKRHTFLTPDLCTHVYFGISGVGAKFDIYVQWLIKQQ